MAKVCWLLINGSKIRYKQCLFGLAFCFSFSDVSILENNRLQAFVAAKSMAVVRFGNITATINDVEYGTTGRLFEGWAMENAAP